MSLLYLFTVLCYSQSAEFQYPVENETFNILDTINVSWASNYETAILFTWVWDPTIDDGQEVSQIPNVTTNGNILYDLAAHNKNISSFPARLWFELMYDLSVEGGINGQGFMVTSNVVATPTTWALSTKFAAVATSSTPGIASSSTLITTATESTMSATTTSSPTGTPNGAGGGDITTGAAAGLGIGVTAFVIGIALLLGYFIFSKRRARKSRTQLAYSAANMSEPKPELEGRSTFIPKNGEENGYHDAQELQEMGEMNYAEISKGGRFEMPGS